MNKYLLMGPLPEPYTGQSVAFSIVVDHLLQNRNNKCTIINLSGKNSILKGIILCFKIFFYVIFSKYDTVYFTCSRSFAGSIRDITLLFWCRFKKAKVINHLHGSDFKLFYDNAPGLYKSLIKWCYKQVDTSIVLLEEMKKQFADFPKMKVVVVPNCYSKDLDALPNTRKNNNEDSVKVIYLSNVMKSKGIIQALHAFDIVASENNNISFHIAGKPIADYLSDEKSITKEFSDTYEKLKQKYHERIEYLGPVFGANKRTLLWESDIFVLPTLHRSESFPISIIEAMRAGNYIISTKHNYIPSIVSLQNGILVTPDSVDSIANALYSILQDRAKLKSVQNYNIKQAVEKYSEKQYLSRVENIICPKQKHIAEKI